ncbi:MAG: LexA family protein [Planctomycetota bacterium]|jgi:hypothetical protein
MITLTMPERRVFEKLIRHRSATGVSPTMAEIAREMRPDKPHGSSRTGVLHLMRSMEAKGWVEKTELPERHWVPTWEARMVEKHGEILRLLDLLAPLDSSAERIRNYILEGAV